ncbi:retrovirus-related pol polyprotein from transposon TNT 1-94 [Tanacetum coccineum]
MPKYDTIRDDELKSYSHQLEDFKTMDYEAKYAIQKHKKAQSHEKDTVVKKLKDKIKSLSGKNSVEKVKKDIDEIETINIELEHSVAKLLSENENLRKEREHLKSIYKDQSDSIRNTRVQSKEHSLKNKLRKLKGKNIVDTAISKPIATIAPGMFKLDIEPISHRLKNTRDAHEVYLENTIENTDTLRGLTCPSLTKPTKKLVAVTPINKDKKVRFVEPVTSSSNITKQTDSLRTKDSNKPLLTSIGVNTTTSASGSMPSGNTKKIRISRPPSSNQKNKVEEHPRKVKSSLNKMNSVFEPISNAHVKHSDEVPEFVIKFLKMIQVRLNATVRNIKTDNGTEFVNQSLRAYYEEVEISHQTSVARSPQ